MEDKGQWVDQSWFPKGLISKLTPPEADEESWWLSQEKKEDNARAYQKHHHENTERHIQRTPSGSIWKKGFQKRGQDRCTVIREWKP